MDYAGSADASDQRAVVEDLRSIGKVVVVVGGASKNSNCVSEM